MSMKLRVILPFVVAGFIGMLLTIEHGKHFADALAEYAGYAFSVLGMPVLIFLSLLSIEFALLPRLRRDQVRSWWPWFLVGLFLTYLPVLAYVFGPRLWGI